MHAASPLDALIFGKTLQDLQQIHSQLLLASLDAKSR